MAEPKYRSTTNWTKLGHRSVVSLHETLASLAIHTRCVHFQTEEARVWLLGEIVFPGGIRRPELERMTQHYVSFFGDDDLTRDAVEAVRELYGRFKEVDVPTRSIPPLPNTH